MKFRKIYLAKQFYSTHIPKEVLMITLPISNPANNFGDVHLRSV
jgi:hypothetical protein